MSGNGTKKPIIVFHIQYVLLNHLTLYLAPKGETGNISEQGSKYYRPTSSLTLRGGFQSMVQVITFTVKCMRSDRSDCAEANTWLSHYGSHFLE